MSSTTAALGARLTTHVSTKARFWLLPICLLLGAFGLFMTLGPWLYPDPRNGLAGDVGLTLLGTFTTLLFFGAPIAVWRQRHRRVDVYEHGIVEQRGASRTELLWDEVSSLVCERAQLNQALGLVTHQIARHSLKTDDGRKLVLDHLLTDIRALGDEVERQVSRCLLPKIKARLAAGESVS